MGNTVGLVPTNGWITGLLSCFNWNIIGKGKPAQIEQSECFSFPFGRKYAGGGVGLWSAVPLCWHGSTMNEQQKGSWQRRKASVGSHKA